MRILRCFFVSGLVIIQCHLFGQCPDSDSLFGTINAVRTSSTLTAVQQRNELMGYEAKMKNCSKDSVYTFLLLSIGVMNYKLADYVSAIRYTRQALNLIHINSDKKEFNQKYLTRYYYYLSIYYDSLRLMSQKNEAIDSCIANEIRENGDYHFASLVLQDNVRDLYNKGDYRLCIARSSLGEMLFHKYYQHDDSINHIFFFIFYKASALEAMARYSEEEQFLSSKQTEFSKVRYKDYRAAMYSLFGSMYKSKGEYKKAIDQFNKAAVYDDFSSKKEIGAKALKEIGTIYSEKLSQNRLALEYYHKALTRATTKQLADANVSDSFNILGSIANLYAKMKSFDSAYYFFQAAFDKIKRGINENDLIAHVDDYVNENVAEALNLVLNKADAYLLQSVNEKNPSALNKALAIYKTADRLLNAIKSGVTDFESKLFWRGYSRRLYEHAIEASYLKKSEADAFYFFEKSRAVLLSDQLNEISNLSESDILKQAQLKKKILMLKKQSAQGKMLHDQSIEIQNEIMAGEIELDRMGKAIMKGNLLYQQSLFDTAFINLQRVRSELLKDHQALVELLTGDSALYIFVVTEQSSFLKKINKTEFDRLSDAYRDFISNPDLLNKNFSAFKNLSLQLYQLLFRDINLPAGRIIISPDGKYFPFESLIANAQPLTYFLEDHSVSYTYSARYLLNDFSTGPGFNSNIFMGFAPLQYSGGLPALSGSDASLTRMQNYFRNATNFVGSEASKNNFINSFYRYKIIQLYTHATDSGAAGEPVIYFSDSVLSLSDLFYEGKPSTNLIVLSACETANGKVYNGEGVFSFSRQFAELGIPSSISNLWQVDNRSSYQITELFYKYLARGLPLDIALQKAKKEFKSVSSKEKNLPYYWAASVLVGRSDAIPLQKKFPWLWLTAILLVLLFVPLGLKIIRRHKAAVQR